MLKTYDARHEPATTQTNNQPTKTKQLINNARQQPTNQATQQTNLFNHQTTH
jgi:hypothetical protein